MLIPLSWLKDYVDIKLPFAELATKLSEAGLTVEKWETKEADTIFDPEVTPNRPDWMSVLGIAREVSAITGAKLVPPNNKLPETKPKANLPISIRNKPEVCPRIVSVIVKGVKVKSSPAWLQKKITQIGLRPINNLVDITNFVLWIYGNPLHVFDYDKIRGHQMVVDLAKGGENFRSLDGIDYHLPKDAIVIKDVGRIIDLPPIKGGENSAVENGTQNVLLHSIVCDPLLTRKMSQKLSLRSDSSAISERGVDPNGTMEAVKLALKLILELAGGEVASEILDDKAHDFSPWIVKLRHSHLEKTLGISIPHEKVLEIFSGLELHAKKEGDTYEVTIPTFRADIHIEEDLIDEVGRIFGYNNFPKTLPQGAPTIDPVAYAKDYDFEYALKQILKGAGYTEIYTYSLVSEKQLTNLWLDPEKALRVDNPISNEYEYLRPHLMGNALEAIKINQPFSSSIRLFELGKIYKGESLDKFSETFQLMGVLTGDSFWQAKGIVQWIANELKIEINFAVPTNDEIGKWLHPGKCAGVYVGKKRIGMIAEIHPALLARFGIKGRVVDFTLDYESLIQHAKSDRKFQPVPKYPAITEDWSLIFPSDVSYGDVVMEIQAASHLVRSLNLIDNQPESKTIRIQFQDLTKNLTGEEVAKVKSKILLNLKKIKVRLKE